MGTPGVFAFVIFQIPGCWLHFRPTQRGTEDAKERIFEGCFKSVIQCGGRARTLSGSVVIFGYANKPNQ